ncbi:MAG: SH3 domain-containing protein [Pseudobdellovibrionaceae bacterium]
MSSLTWANSAVVYDIGRIDSAKGVNVRSSMTLNSKILGMLYPKDSFAVAPKNDWYVILDGPYTGGYVRHELVKLVGEKYSLKKVAAQSVRVRASATERAPVKGSLNTNDVFAGEKKGDWFEIKDGPMRGGFVSAQFISDLDALPERDATPEQATVQGNETPIIVDSNAPAEPALKAESTDATLASAATTEPTTTTTLPSPAPPPAPPPTASAFSQGLVIAKNSVNVRQAPTTKSPTVGSASPGLTFEVEPAGEGWYKIQSGLNKGRYISAPFVKINSPTESASAAGASAKPTVANSTFAPSPNWDSKTEKIFQDQVDKVFKKKAKPEDENHVVMPVYFEDRSISLGQIDSRIRQGQPLLVDSLTLFKYLRLLLLREWFDKPQITAINPEGIKDPQEISKRRWLSLDQFAETGIKVTFDPAQLDVIISVPPALRAPSVASIIKGDRNVDDAAQADPASLFSSYLNIYASETFDTRYKEFDDHRLPMKAQLENGTNLGGVVMEAYGRYLEDRTNQNPDSTGFARGDVRLVKDFPGGSARSSVGDLVYPTQGFQTFRPMAGASVTTNFTMSRSRLTYPTGNYDIFLQRNSKVYIWLNDQLQQVLDLPAGRHSLRDFPFVSGANDLRLEIVDDVGREETVRYSYFSSTEMLKTGLNQFNYSVGAPSEDIGNQRIYDSSKTTLTAFHRYGLTEDLTVGANVQNDHLQTVAGLEGMMSTSFGFLKLEPAVSILNSETGGAVRGSYSYSDYKGIMKTQRTYRLSFVHEGASFAPLSQNASLPVVTRTFELTGGYTQGLSRNLSVNFNASVRNLASALGNQDAFTIGVGANRKWDGGQSVNATISHNKTTAGDEDINVFLFFLWAFPKEKQIVTAIHNTSDSSSRLDWSYNPSAAADSSSYGASLRDTDSERGYSAQILHDGNRTRSSLAHEVAISKIADPTATGDDVNKKPTSHTTSLNVATSLAFAGGHFAIGRPVTDSFAIIAPVKNLRGQRLDVNPQGEEAYAAKSDLLGPALLPEIGSYNFTEITISGKKLPPQLAVPRDHFSVYPGYKSGYAFEIGTDATVYLMAKLVDGQGQPLGLAAGTAIYLDDDKQEPVTIFTNKKGVLSSEGFKPGRYRFEVATDVFEPLEITIPESAKDNFDLGTLKLKAK